MVRTAAEQAIIEYLVAEPGPARQVSSGGGAGADPATIQFRRSRTFAACQLHSVTFTIRNGGPAQHSLIRTWPEPDGSWSVGPVGGGSGDGPHRSRPWVNFTAQWNGTLFAAGGEVTGDGAERAHLVRLLFADGTAIEDEVGRGVVLFFASPGVAFPARVEILDNAGVSLASYDEFDL